MRKRDYTKNSPQVSEIGFGAWQLGNTQDWAPMTEDEGLQLVQRSIELGVNFFDTAPNYGLGNSETLLGKALKNVDRSTLVINTKFGHHVEGNTDYSPSVLRQSIEGSLKRLQMNYLDSVLLHNPPADYLESTHPIYKELDKLKEEGLIKAYGSSVDSAKDMFTVLNSTESEVMEVLFNIFHQDTRQAFAKAEEKGIALISKIPLDSGWLSGKYDATSKFDGIRSRWSPVDIRRRAELLEKISFLTQDGITLSQAALSYILHYKSIATVIPGAKNITQLEENVKVSDLPLKDDTVKRLEEFYDEQIKFNPLPW
jgi:aryl-alcohol dehydrogenase-like predicted oxidoreductase